jgi:curved DNA-binding protein
MAGGGYRDYFKVLELERGADANAVKKAFRRLARQYHPDVNPGDANAEARFKEISEAYEVLSDPEKRQRYEKFGQYWNQAGAAPGAGFDVDFGRYGNFDDFINDLLGRFSGPGGFGMGGFPNAASQGPNLDAEANLKVAFAEAFHGCERSLQVNQEKVQVRIPAGVRSGSRLRLKGKGNLQPSSGRRGDLYLNIQLEQHPIWSLDGDLMRGNLPLSPDEAVLGGELKVPTPDGEAVVTVPAGISGGRSLRLKGKGWPLRQGRGDLLLTIELQLPENLSQEERNSYERLRQVRAGLNLNPRAQILTSSKL